jgi:hypothetical protein
VTFTVTAWATDEGFGEEVTEVVVFAFPTVTGLLAGEVLPV